MIFDIFPISAKFDMAGAFTVTAIAIKIMLTTEGMISFTQKRKLMSGTLMLQFSEVLFSNRQIFLKLSFFMFYVSRIKLIA